MVRPGVVVGTALVLFGAVASGASAAPRPPVIPAVAQYIEVLPTSGGNAVPTGKGRTRLPEKVARKLGSSTQDKLLRAVATSAAYGAPQHPARVKKHVAVKPRRVAPKSKSTSTVTVSRSAFGASVDAVGTDRSVVVWLAVALLAIAAVGVGASITRARRSAR
jgi:hypothetical protein